MFALQGDSAPPSPLKNRSGRSRRRLPPAPAPRPRLPASTLFVASRLAARRGPNVTTTSTAPLDASIEGFLRRSVRTALRHLPASLGCSNQAAGHDRRDSPARLCGPRNALRPQSTRARCLSDVRRDRPCSQSPAAFPVTSTRILVVLCVLQCSRSASVHKGSGHVRAWASAAPARPGWRRSAPARVRVACENSSGRSPVPTIIKVRATGVANTLR